MWDTNILKQQLEKLKKIKNDYCNRHIEFWISGYTDSLNTVFKDNDLKENEKCIIVGGDKNELVDKLLDTAINYLEEKIKMEEKLK